VKEHHIEKQADGVTEERAGSGGRGRGRRCERKEVETEAVYWLVGGNARGQQPGWVL
jgi:hypothetical protein